MKKLLIIIMVIGLNLFAGNAPLKLKTYTVNIKKGYVTPYIALDATVIVDKLKISNIIVNRGKCRVYIYAWPVDGVKLYKKNVCNYDYGEHKKVFVSERCELIEVTYETDQGNFTWEF